MQRRIMGIETEFGITCTFHGQRRLSPDEVASYLFRRVVSWGRSSNVFLRNGSRLYLDVGSHPEYATAECDDLPTLIAHDKAGERILQDLVVDAETRLAEEGIGGDIYLFKNNTDSAGNSYGCHENFLIARGGEFAKIADGLIPFLVTRQLIAGAGKVLQSPRGASYCLSQRADHIWEGVSSATTRSRPIINTRDEPHADAERYRRLHVIVGDSNMSETTTLLKVGSAALVLEMIEAGVPLRDFTFENPIRAIREISHDTTGASPVRLAGGGDICALDAQTDYYEQAAEFVAKRGSDPVTERVLDLWRRTLQAVQTQDFSERRHRDRLDHQEEADRRVRGQARPGPHPSADRAARPDLPRRAGRTRPALAARREGPGGPGGHRRSRSSRRRRCRRRPPGPGCAASSSPRRRTPVATTPSTGCTSSSTTRRSARCC